MDALFRPELTLPDAEADWITSAYQAASVILEYGSGGSTVLASEMTGKSIFSVESDRDWCENLRGLTQNSVSPVHMHYANIGPTGKWGRPKSDAHWKQYFTYPLSVWDRPDFMQPDVVLIDGRFRQACFLATLFKTNAPVTVYFDDYVPRSKYHAVERYVRPVEIRGRMAKFEITKQPIAPNDLGLIISAFAETH